MHRSSLASKFQESLLFPKSVLRSFLYRHTHAAYKENLGDIYCSFRLSWRSWKNWISSFLEQLSDWCHAAFRAVWYSLIYMIDRELYPELHLASSLVQCQKAQIIQYLWKVSHTKDQPRRFSRFWVQLRHHTEDLEASHSNQRVFLKCSEKKCEYNRAEQKSVER